MGAILNQPWGGAYMNDVKVLGDDNLTWHQLDSAKVVTSSPCPPITRQAILYRVDKLNKRLQLSVSFGLSSVASTINSVKPLVTLDFSEIIANITGFKNGMSNGMGIGMSSGMDAVYSGAKIIMNMTGLQGCWPDASFWVSYDQLV
ncbi:hypothetical protein [Lentilactobacillus buchneri]|uniref:hypothetical protein n=1 Tax=Lentilactobacillus buchneri TaxID=1581 RepID=UPI0011EF0857|nr:hypothetical protein [Lentilactobacillus buchneri]